MKREQLVELGPAINRSGTVADISDANLLKRAVLNARSTRGRRYKQPRWVHVSDTFALGSTYSCQLCRRFGIDPEEQIK